MNGVLEILVSLVFFVPMAASVALNLMLYAEERYTAQPPAPMLPGATESEPEPYELRKAA